MLETNFYPNTNDLCFIKRLVMKPGNKKPGTIAELLKAVADKSQVVVIWNRDAHKPGSTCLHNSYADELDANGIGDEQRFVINNPYASSELKEKFDALRKRSLPTLAFYAGSSTAKCYPYIVRYADILIDVSYGGFRIIKWKE